MGLLDYLSDSEERAKLTRGLLDAINRGGVGGLLGAPVDIANMALRPVGLGSDNPVMGSEWIGGKMQQTGMVSNQRNPLAEGLAGFVDPGTLAPVAMKAAAYGAPLLAALGATAIGSKASEGAKFSDMANVLAGQRGATAWHGSPHPLESAYTKALTDDPYAVYGLRVIPRGHEVKAGDYLENSKRWDDGKITDEELSGVSTVGIEKNNIQQALDRLKASGYSGKQIALVKGESGGYGEDAYERLIKNGEVVSEYALERNVQPTGQQPWDGAGLLGQ